MPPAGTPTFVLSLRAKNTRISWYADRIEGSEEAVLLTGAFGINERLANALTADPRPFSASCYSKATHQEGQGHPGPRPLGHRVLRNAARADVSRRHQGCVPRERRPITEFELDKWFLKEGHYRRANDGFVFFVHAKFMLVDPLPEDPLVSTGSANVSPDSVLQHDENMLLIRETHESRTLT